MGNKSKNTTGKKWKQIRNLAKARIPKSSRSWPGLAPRRIVEKVSVLGLDTNKPLRALAVQGPTQLFHDSSRLGTLR